MSTREDAIVCEHEPLVRAAVLSIARTLPWHVDADDLRAAGRVGLLAAVRRYDPARGVAFSTFAWARIRGAVVDELRRLDHLSRSQRSAERAAPGSQSPPPEPLTEWLTDPAPGPEALAESAERVALVRAAVARLPEAQRVVIVECELKERPYRTVTGRLNVGESMVSKLRERALSALREALAVYFLALAFVCAGCAATNTRGTRAGSRIPEARSEAVAATVAAAAPAADSGSYVLEFHMPTLHAFPGGSGSDSTKPLSEGYRRFEIGYSCQSLQWRDSVATYGPAWGRDLSNMADWLPGAQIVVVLSGYARPGEFVTVRPPLVSSLYTPWAWWVRSWTGVPSAWSNPTRSIEHN